MCDDIQFYKDKLKCYVAIAPVVSVANLGSQILIDYANSQSAFGALMSTGPEIFVHAASDNALKRNIVGTSIGTMLAG